MALLAPAAWAARGTAMRSPRSVSAPVANCSAPVRLGQRRPCLQLLSASVCGAPRASPVCIRPLSTASAGDGPFPWRKRRPITPSSSSSSSGESSENETNPRSEPLDAGATNLSTSSHLASELSIVSDEVGPINQVMSYRVLGHETQVVEVRSEEGMDVREGWMLPVSC